MVLSLLASGGPNDAPPFFILLTVVFMGIIAIALILAHFRQSLLAGYFICGVILANCGILDHIPRQHPGSFRGRNYPAHVHAGA